MNDEFPEALQIEVTNKCNFNCQMCIRHVWNVKPLGMDIALYRKITKTSFSELKRLVLYGFGEPFIHPQILEMLRLARENLPEDGEIITSTNGSLITTKTACRILEIGVDSIAFSVDTVNEAKLSRLREGSDFNLIVNSIEKLAKNRDKAAREFRLGLETVIMDDNFLELPELVEFAAEKNIDYIFVSRKKRWSSLSMSRVYVCSSRLCQRPQKNIHEVIFGNLARKEVEEVWRLNAYVNFREVGWNMALGGIWLETCLGVETAPTQHLDVFTQKPTM